MEIFRNINGVKTSIHDLDVDSQTELRQSISGEDLITSRFIVEGVKMDIQIGDFVEFKDSVYTILDEPTIKKEQNTFTYNLQFKSDQYVLKNVQVMLDDEAEFYLYGNAITMVSLIISNLNRVYTDGLYFADYVEQTESKNITFNNENALAALQRMADEFDCEFTVKGKKITFRKKIGQETGLVFKYRKELKSIERQTLQSAELLTVLYPYGSSRNVTNDYGSKRLKIPKVEKNVELFGTIERSVTFDEVYPRFKGNVGAVTGNNVFTDTGINFNINNQLIGGATAKVVFNTGDLAGREFEIGSYNSASNKVELLYYTDDSDLRLPNDILKPRTGDKYVFINIKMPQEYIDAAEAELLEKANEYMEKYSQPNVIYKIAPHFPALRAKDLDLNLGDIVIVQDEDFGIEFPTRILSINQKLANKFEYSLEIGNQVSVSYFTQVMNDQKDLRNNFYQNNRYWTEQFNRVFNSVTDFNAPVYVNMGAFNPETYYYNNQNRRDYVYLINQSGVKEWYYFRGEDHSRGEFILANWQLIGDNFDIIATQTILAENANIGNWIIQNGQIVSQEQYKNEPRAQLNGLRGYIKLVSPVSVYGNGGYREYRQELLMDSRSSSFRAYRAGDAFQDEAEAVLSSDGLRASFPGLVTYNYNPAVPDNLVTDHGLASVVAIGTAKLSTSVWNGFKFIAGVVGRVWNTATTNAAPAFGGVFWSLKSYGRNVGIKRIINEQLYKCHIYDEYIMCYNTKYFALHLPENPVDGRFIQVRRINSSVRVYSMDKQIVQKGNASFIDINQGDAWTFIYDGGYWFANYQGRTS
jgi:hypothetical protein